MLPCLVNLALVQVRRKEREFMTMQKLKLRTDEMCNRLNADIQRIKQQKASAWLGLLEAGGPRLGGALMDSSGR